MKQEKSFLGEVAANQEAIKTSRSDPIQQEIQPRQTMDFIRSLILDIPVQNYKEADNMNIEKMIETQLEAEVKKLEKPADAIDTVTVDVPLLLRLLEYAKEDAKTDMDLHNVTEKLVSLSKENEILSMDHYDAVVQSADSTEPKEPFSGDQQYESLVAIQKLAGIK